MEVQECVGEPILKLIESIMSASSKKQLAKFALYKLTHGISEFMPLSSRELEALRIQVVSPLCAFGEGVFPCFYPEDGYQTLTSKCLTGIDEKSAGYAWHMFRSIYHHNGSRIIGKDFQGYKPWKCIWHVGNIACRFP